VASAIDSWLSVGCWCKFIKMFQTLKLQYNKNIKQLPFSTEMAKPKPFIIDKWDSLFFKFVQNLIKTLVR